jgi:cytoskeleton protein RodZ
MTESMSQDPELPVAGTRHEPDESNAPEPAKSAVSPGELLHRARESLNLTISDLAGQTRLSRNVLEALERNDFANLAMPVYVRGYFRKCAHVLNLPEEKLLQAYADWTGTPLKAQPLPVTVNEPPREYSSPTRTPSWRYVLVIAIVIGAVLWWFGSGGQNSSTVIPAADTPVTTLDIEPPVLASQPLPLGPAEEVIAVPSEVVTSPTTGDAPTATSPATDQTTSPSTGVAESTAAAIPAGPNTLEFNISRNSWVEVYDDEKRRLVYGLLTTGTEQRVSGKPPYQVVLGHPQGVKLSIGGKPIDLAPHTSSSGTARLEVDAR